MIAPELNVALGRPVPARPKAFSRAAFRARLLNDSRRWVLALAAAEGLVWFALTYDEKLSKPRPGYMLLVGLAFVLVSPALGVVVLFVQGRILYWGGGLLGGKARPAEIRAAIAWSQWPLLLVGWPAVLHLATRVAIAETEPVPGWLLFLGDLFRALTGWSHKLAVVAGIFGVVLYVRYLAEAQGFTGSRAIVSHVLAVVLAVVVLGAGIGLGWALTSI